LVSERDGIVPKRNIILYQSLIKKDKMEWVVEKATELGVSKIVPIVSERSEKKGFNIERAKKIAVEASEQCGRADVSEISEVTDLNEVLENCNNPIIFDKSGSTFDPSLIYKNHNTVSIFIGPEGGWTEKELELFKQKGASVFSLGSLTLRAETAALTAIVLARLR
jgi:16S rRNA (uracil1498-N3)-methyltransferase